jgi:hypothetical protein
MAKAYQRWTVQPHDKLVPVDPRIMTVVGYLKMPLTRLPRRMTVVRLRDGRLVIYSAIALRDGEMAELERFGRPAFLVVPSDKHRLDARAWKDRYPDMLVVAPRGGGERVADVVMVDSTSPDFGDPDVRYFVMPGTGENEAVLVVRTHDGTTLVLNDIIGNIRGARIVKRLLIKDRAAVREQLLLWAKDESIRRILMSHGDIIDAHPRDTLMKLAESLG